MKFGVLSNKSKDPEGKLLDLICSRIKAHKQNLTFCRTMDKYEDITELPLNETDLILSMGGDGTFLNIARQTAVHNIPIMGINTGSLGFLSATDIKDIDSAIKKIISKDYTVERRMMVKAVIEKEGNEKSVYHALNDIVIARGLLSRIVTLKVYIDGDYVDTFPGDGIIVSTPTGSTGYSLSAGGPVTAHDMDLMILTPICPHIMHAKSFIAHPESEIRIDILEKKNYSCSLTADGQKGFELTGGDQVKIVRSEYGVRIVKFAENALFSTLRNKIYYRNGESNET